MTQVALLLSLLGSLPDATDAGVLPPLRVQQRVTPAQARLGEPFVVEIVVTHEKSQRYELPPPGDLGAFDYVSQDRQRVDGDEASITTFKVTLQGFELGKQRTPTLELELADPAGTVKMPVSGTEVEILSTLPPDAKDQGADFYDVRKPEELPVRTWRLIWALLIGLAVALASYALFRWLNRPRPVVTAPAKPREPAHVRARTALDALAAQNLPAQGRVKEFYFRLSEIIRSYLGEVYAFDALESTTPELLEALRARHTPGLPMEALKDFAYQSDFVRYAKQEPGPDECKGALELGYRIVHSTVAALAAPRPAGGDGAS
ncbi:MAG: hypothetical protein JNJ54_12670 [Myxococcaceae bacterium]|nr:hypothetical protein [Myxococcaceae bacterium]